MAALDRLILREGYTSLGVNSVAKEASVSKVLIYRYFESFEGLLETWALNNSYWSGDLKVLNDESKASSNAKSVLGGYARSLREDPIKREILRWFLAEKTNVGASVMARMEEQGNEAIKHFKQNLKDDRNLDIESIITILSAGISYLSLLSDRADQYNGINLNSDEGWNRLENTIVEMIRRLLE